MPQSSRKSSPVFFISPEGLKLVSVKLEGKTVVVPIFKGNESSETSETANTTKDTTSSTETEYKKRKKKKKISTSDIENRKSSQLSCDVCQETFAETQHLKKHKIQVHPANFVCDICKKGYISKYHLKQHTNKVHPPNAVDLKCHLCDYKTHNRFNLKGHIDRHNKAASFICDICGKGCYSRGTLEEHKQGKHGSGFPCEVCGAALTSVSNLRQHRKTHEPKPAGVKYQCDVCGQGFRARSKCAFRLHVLRHQGIIKQFKCTHCDKVLTSDNSYRQHMRKHSGEKPFICEFCSKAFSEKKYLQVHRRIHTGEKPYECDICGSCFNQRSTMTSHRRSHGKSNRSTHCIKTEQNIQTPCDENKSLNCIPIKTENDIDDCYGSREMFSDFVMKTEDHEIDISYDNKPELLVEEDVLELSNDENYIDGSNSDELSNLTAVENLNTTNIAPKGKYEFTIKRVCPLCKRSYSRRPCLRIHMNSFHGTYYCTVCDLNCDTSIQLGEHLKSHKTEKELVICTICCQKFANKKYLREHKNRVHSQNKQDNKCPYCSYENDVFVEMSLHISTHKFKCAKCKVLYSQENELQTHLDSFHKEEIQCGLCQNFFSRKAFEPHLRRHNPENHVKDCKHKCDKCAKVFKSPSFLKIHSLTHNTKLFKCISCKFVTKHRKSFEAHVKIHMGESSWICEICGKGYLSKATLDVHKLHHTREKLYSCNQCEKGFFNRNHLLQHKRSHTSEKPYVCDFCNKCFKRKFWVGSHLMKVHLKSGQDIVQDNKTKHCNKKKQNHIVIKSVNEINAGYDNGKSHNELRTNNVVDSQDVEYCSDSSNSVQELDSSPANISTNEITNEGNPCPICQKVFPVKKSLRIHMNNFHGTFYCTVCDLKCYHSLQLGEHLKLHVSEKTFIKCNQCNMTFVSKKYLNEHTRQNHAQSSNNKCPYCDFESDIDFELNIHIQAHQFECTNCREIFFEEEQLQAHLSSVHLSEFSCDTCQKCFTTMRKLKEHEKSHKPDFNKSNKKNVCEYCYKDFKTAWDLRRHIMTHGKKLQCSFCDFKSKNMAILETHEKTHTSGGSPWICDVCDRGFLRKSSLKSHRKTHTGLK